MRLYVAVPVPDAPQTVWTVTSQPMGAQFTLARDSSDSALFTSETEGLYRLTVSAPSASTDAGLRPDAYCELLVVVRASGPVAICPADTTTTPGTVVTLAGEASVDSTVSSTVWSLTHAPASSGLPVPIPSDSLATRFTPDAAGDFTLQLIVTDGDGAIDHCTTVVHALVTDGLRVELSWDPPGRTCPMAPRAACDNADVDVHLLRASGARGWGSDDDCYWYNCDAEASRVLYWPGTSTGTNPSLDHDVVNGHGPESLTVPSPVERSYRVGVHYFENHGASDQVATVRIYCRQGTVEATVGPVVLQTHGGHELNDFWIAADVMPTATGCTVQPITRAGGPYLVPWNHLAQDRGPPPP